MPMGGHTCVISCAAPVGPPWGRPCCRAGTWRASACCSCAATCGCPGYTWPQTASCRSHTGTASGPGASPCKYKHY